MNWADFGLSSIVLYQWKMALHSIEALPVWNRGMKEATQSWNEHQIPRPLPNLTCVGETQRSDPKGSHRNKWWRIVATNSRFLVQDSWRLVEKLSRHLFYALYCGNQDSLNSHHQGFQASKNTHSHAELTVKSGQKTSSSACSFSSLKSPTVKYSFELGHPSQTNSTAQFEPRFLRENSFNYRFVWRKKKPRSTFPTLVLGLRSHFPHRKITTVHPSLAWSKQKAVLFMATRCTRAKLLKAW